MTDLIKAADALAEATRKLRNAQRAYLASKECRDPIDTQQSRGAQVGKCAAIVDTALTAYRQARESADGVRVKPLDMPERRNGYWGNKDGYQVAHTRDNLFRVRFHGKVIRRDIRGFDRAVEWANKHNEARIKAALVPND